MKKQAILVIDDSSDMLALQQMILEADGFEVLTARTGADALEILSGIKGLDLIILDMQLDDMNGETFLARLEERTPEIIAQVPVVILSGAEPPPTKAVGFIRKFPDVDEFLAAIHQFINTGLGHPHPQL